MIELKPWYSMALGLLFVAMNGLCVAGFAIGFKLTGAAGSAFGLLFVILVAPMIWHRREMYEAANGDMQAAEKLISARFSVVRWKEVRRG